MVLARTPSQTVGPYLTLGLTWDDGPDVVPDGEPLAIWIRGRLLDGHDDPVPDGLVETWQADGAGQFPPAVAAHADARSFRGFGRCPTDPEGGYAIRTIKPGMVAARDGRAQAPHIDVSVFARGLLSRLVTRIYFADEADANSADPILESVPADRRDTLLASPTDDGYVFDIHLQGKDETVFFDV
jgi:protocatechuate 3,4-dioxygenase, alpha subunit